MLAPLTKLTLNKTKFKWTKIELDAFYKIKQIVVHNTLLTYPIFNETFNNHTNARSFQLVVVICQKGTLIAFYSEKLTDAQQRYTVT